MNKTTFKADKNTLTITRIFNASVDLVWKAWTQPDLLDQWWAPKPWRSETKHMEFREGGYRLYAMLGPEGEEHWGRTDYESIKELSNFSGQDSFCDNDGIVQPDFPVARFQNHFVEEGSSTAVTIITQYESEAHLNQVLQMGMKEGLGMAFQSLDELLTALR